MKLYIGNYIWRTTPYPHWALPAGMVAGLDMRPLAEQSQQSGAGGQAIFAGDSNDSSLDFLGRGDELIDKRAKSALAKRFAAVDGATLADAIVTLLMRGDPKGDLSHRPLLPTSGFFELHIGNKLKSSPFVWGDTGTSSVRDVLRADFRKEFERDPSHAKKVLGHWTEQYKLSGEKDWEDLVPVDLRAEIDGPRKPSTTYTDSFTRANEALDADANWQELSGTWTVTSNRAQLASGSSAVQYARWNGDLSSSDNYAQASCDCSSNSYQGVTCRYQSAANTGYACEVEWLEDVVALYKFVTGTSTSLGSASSIVNTPGTPVVMKTEANGSAIKSYSAGVQRVSVTDTAVSSGLRGGLWGYDNATDYFDDFEMSDLAASSILYTQLERGTRGLMRGTWAGH